MSDGSSRRTRSRAASLRSSEAAGRGMDIDSRLKPLVEVLPLRVILVVEVVSIVFEVVLFTVRVLVFVVVVVIVVFFDRLEFHGRDACYFEIRSAVWAAD